VVVVDDEDENEDFDLGNPMGKMAYVDHYLIAGLVLVKMNS
jgi:hypothetical protein